MKTILIITLSASIAFAQTIYKITPGSKGNKIILMIENESKEKELTNVKVKLNEQLSSLYFHSTEESIERVEKGNSKETEFSFDVNITDDASRTDTLRFQITGSEGTLQQKEILIGYELPTEYVLEQNYPNPFNPSTTIRFAIPEAGRYTIKVYNILGQEVVTLLNEELNAGVHNVKFNASNIASGMYIYKLSGEKVNISKKMILMK